MSEDLFPKEFIDGLRKSIPLAEEQLTLAEKRLEVAKAAGAEIGDQQKRVFELRERVRKIKGAFRLT